MIKKWLARVRLDRVEAIYLMILRVAGLAVATLCILAALFFLGDALWRFAVPTDVKAKPTEVSAEAIAQAMKAPPRNTGNDQTPDYIKQAHKTFETTVWPRYYAIYKSAFDRHKKPDDTLVSSTDLMNNLGYGLEAYTESMGQPDGYTYPNVRFVTDPAYQAMAIKTVGEAMAAPTTSKLFRDYAAASKSEQRCVTVPRTQVISQTCGYYYVYDCSYTRTVREQRCEAVYPDGIVSPIQAFERADRSFIEAYFTDERRKQADASAKRERRQATRAQIGPRLMLAFIGGGIFLAVMFLFLIIAIERHLRRLAEAR